MSYIAAVGWKLKLVSPILGIFLPLISVEGLHAGKHPPTVPPVLCKNALSSGLTQGSSWKDIVIWKLQMSLSYVF